MDDDRFWQLIANTDGDCERLLPALVALDDDAILGFDRIFNERVRDAFRSDLWEIAYLAKGGCSDDGFDYFLGWLIGRGRAHYDAALADPERAVDGVEPDPEGDLENGDLWNVATRAYEQKTGRDDFYQRATSVKRTLQGGGFDEDTVAERHPAIAARFGM